VLQGEAEIRFKVGIASEVECTPRAILRVPRQPGIYWFRDHRGILYVGQTDSLRRRYKGHVRGTENRRLREYLGAPVGNLFRCWVLCSPTDLDVLERTLIRFFTPACNRILYPVTR
jgi:excinuclease UvrABC nuclease subunit